MTSRAAIAFIALAGAAFATSGPIARLARPAHPDLVAFGRVALASCVLLLVERRLLRAAVLALPRHGLLRVAGVGALLAAHFALFIGGLDATSLPAAVSLVSLEPLSVVVFAWLIHGVVPSRGERAGVILATAGAVVVGSGAGVGEHRLVGDLMVVGAVVLYGLYIAAARGLGPLLPPRTYAGLVYGFAALALLPVLVGIELTRGALPSLVAIPPRSILAITALALIPTLVGHTAVQTAARHAPPALVALVSPAETVGAIAISALLLGQPPSLQEAVGAVVIVAGVALTLPRG